MYDDHCARRYRRQALSHNSSTDVSVPDRESVEICGARHPTQILQASHQGMVDHIDHLDNIDEIAQIQALHRIQNDFRSRDAPVLQSVCFTRIAAPLSGKTSI